MAEAADYCFIVPSFSIHRIQESHVALLHILWDLTHVAMGEEDVAYSLEIAAFFSQTYPATGPDLTKLLFWSFLAGFSERFVPQILDKAQVHDPKEPHDPSTETYLR